MNFVKGQTWVSVTFVREHLVSLANGDETVENCVYLLEGLQCVELMSVSDKFTDEDKQKFSNPEYYKNFRRALESDLNVREDREHSSTADYFF